MKIAHSAFIDLENALGQRVAAGWKRIFHPIQQELHGAINVKDWAKANKLVDTLNTDVLVDANLKFANTIAVSALLLGASRLGKVTDSHVAQHPPLHQIKNALTQWGFVVARNAVQNVRLSLHLMLARVEHESEQARHTITKFDPYHDAEGKFTSADSVLATKIRMAPDGPGPNTVQNRNIDETANDAVASAPVTDIDPKTLSTTQPMVESSRLGAWDQAKAPPVEVMKYRGTLYITQGNHRVSAALAAGVATIKARVLDLDAPENQKYVLSKYRVKKDESSDPAQYLDDPELRDLIDSIQVDGADFMSLAANLMVSRLSSFGFLLEAQQQGIEKYEISAILDDHTCPVCEALDGQVFTVQDGIAQAASIMEADDADSLKSVAPWPSQSKASVADLQNSDAQDLVDSGLALPPYHAGCRCITVDATDESQSSTADQTEALAADIQDNLPNVSEDEINAILGLALIPDELGFAGEDDEEDLTDDLEEEPDDVDEELDDNADPEDPEELEPKKKKNPVDV